MTRRGAHSFPISARRRAQRPDKDGRIALVDHELRLADFVRALGLDDSLCWFARRALSSQLVPFVHSQDMKRYFMRPRFAALA